MFPIQKFLFISELRNFLKACLLAAVWANSRMGSEWRSAAKAASDLLFEMRLQMVVLKHWLE